MLVVYIIYYLLGFRELLLFFLLCDIFSDVFFFFNCLWRFLYNLLILLLLLIILVFFLVVLLCFFFWGGDGCVVLRLVVDRVMLLVCDVELLRSRGKLFWVIFMFVCLRSFLRVFKFDCIDLFWLWGKEYGFWLCEWCWFIRIFGIWGWVWFFIMFWVFRWLKVISVLLFDMLLRFWFELFFFILLIEDFDIVFGEVIWCMCDVFLVFFGVIWFVLLRWIFVLNVVFL